jgi:thiol-disulfide isomerase/thioredoxin
MLKHLFYALSVLFLAFAIVRATIPEIDQADRETFPANLSGFNLVEFYAPSCKHCRTFSKTMKRIAEYSQSNDANLLGLKVLQFNCHGGSFCRPLDIRSIPTLRLYLNDEVIAENRGSIKFKAIVKWLDENLACHRGEETIESIRDFDQSFTHNHHDEEEEPTPSPDTESQPEIPPIIASPIRGSTISSNLPCTSPVRPLSSSSISRLDILPSSVIFQSSPQSSSPPSTYPGSPSI